MRVWSIAAVSLMSLAACRQGALTEARVFLGSDLEGVDGYRVAIVSPEGRESRFDARVEDGETPSFAIVPSDGDVSRRITVHVAALRDGVQLLSTTRVVTGFVPGGSVDVFIFLAARCIGADVCGGASACGACGCVPLELAFNMHEELACHVDEDAGVVFDAGADRPVAVDAAAQDAGPPEAGSGDAEVSDVNGRDTPITERLFRFTGAEDVALNAVAQDENGGFVAGGWFSGALVIDNMLSRNAMLDKDALLVRFDDQGVYLWSHVISGGTYDQEITGVTFDRAGNTYATLTAHRAGGIELDGMQLRSPDGGNDTQIYVMAFNPFGDHMRTAVLGATDDDHSAAIAYDALRHRVIVTGDISGTSSFASACALAPTVLSDWMVAALDADTFHCAWSAQASSIGPDIPGRHGLAVSSSQVFVSGAMGEAGEVTGGVNDLPVNHVSLLAQDFDAVVVALDAADGIPQAATTIGQSASDESALALAWHARSRRLLLGGSFPMVPLLVQRSGEATKSTLGSGPGGNTGFLFLLELDEELAVADVTTWTDLGGKLEVFALAATEEHYFVAGRWQGQLRFPDSTANKVSHGDGDGFVYRRALTGPAMTEVDLLSTPEEDAMLDVVATPAAVTTSAMLNGETQAADVPWGAMLTTKQDAFVYRYAP